MATYSEIANSQLLLGLVFLALTVLLGVCGLFLRIAWKRGAEVGLSANEMLKAVKSTAIFSVIPSLAIVIGLFAIVTLLGNAWALFRLSVIGSVVYETIVAKGVMITKGWDSIPEHAPGTVFVEIMFVTSICILLHIILPTFFGKALHTKQQATSKKDKNWAIILNSSFFPAVLIVFSSQYLIEALFGAEKSIGLLTLLTTGIAGLILGKITAKFTPSLCELVAPACLIIGMCSSLLWTGLIQG